jgi:hypothetical protein
MALPQLIVSQGPLRRPRARVPAEVGYFPTGVARWQQPSPLNTVRTIIDKQNGIDRTTKNHRQRLERIEIERDVSPSGKRQSEPATPYRGE